MKRSDLNAILADGADFIRNAGYVLPPFAGWTPGRMRSPEAATIRARGLGWDVTDYAQERFDNLGLFLFTVRNGRAADLGAGRGMLYAEKIMISRVAQISPLHRHIVKAEDIVNRGGGDLVVELYAPDADGGVDREAEVFVPCDGVMRTFPAGGHLRLLPGESVTLMPGIWHAFWAERGACLIGEVSTVNDDRIDNVFADDLPRFADVDEDAEPTRLLVSDY